MPDHAISILFQDMTSLTSHLTNKVQQKYGNNFSTFDLDNLQNLKSHLTRKLSSIPNADKLKIFITGHGGFGVQYIANEARVKKVTVDDLVNALAKPLQQRAASPRTSPNTLIDMNSCLFGRSIDASFDNCPAVRLHRGLAQKDVFVDLVARTESLTSSADGRTSTPRVEDKLNSDFNPIRKAQFTKIKCTYQDGRNPIVFIRDYTKDAFIGAGDVKYRRILWADHVVNQFVSYMKTEPRIGGDKISDERHFAVSYLLKGYENNRDAVQLKDGLARLVAEDNKSTDTNKNFLIHRNWYGLGTPKTAAFIIDLLNQYPG